MENSTNFIHLINHQRKTLHSTDSSEMVKETLLHLCLVQNRNHKSNIIRSIYSQPYSISDKPTHHRHFL
jgi:hypothetical protein